MARGESPQIKPEQRKCRYRQAQTRSADEPMTVRTIGLSIHHELSLFCFVLRFVLH